MKQWQAIGLGMGLAVALQAATLEVYRDGALYTYTPRQAYVGFAGQGLQARCGARPLEIYLDGECPASERLCGIREKIRRLRREADEAGEIRRVLERLAGNVHFKDPDARQLIKEADTLGRRMAELAGKEKEKNEAFAREKARFMKGATSWDAAYLSGRCEGPVTLKLPRGWITFEVGYDLERVADDGVRITQRMRVRNRSGIDIDVPRATFVYEPMRQGLRPIRFVPWIVRDAKSAPRLLYKRAEPVSDRAVAEAVPAAAPSAGAAKVRRPRHYRVADLHLPSSPEGVEVKLQSWRQNAEFLEVAYPWRAWRVYEAVRFRPGHAIDTNRWRFVQDGKAVATGLQGSYIDGRYTLFVKTDDDLVVERKRLILKEKESFFGSTVRKKDGYVVTVVNQSDEKKELTLIERIPVASRSDVKVELLKVAAKGPMRYRLGREGRLQIDLTLPPHATDRVKVLFQISYEKKKPVVY